MAWRCRILTARPSQHGRVIAENAPGKLVDFHTDLDGIKNAALALRALERVVLLEIDLLLAGLPVRRRDEDALALAPRELDVGLGGRQGHASDCAFDPARCSVAQALSVWGPR